MALIEYSIGISLWNSSIQNKSTVYFPLSNTSIVLVSVLPSAMVISEELVEAVLFSPASSVVAASFLLCMVNVAF